MESPVVLPASGASNGFSTASSSAMTSSSSAAHSTYSVDADVQADPRPCADDTTSTSPETSSTSPDRSVISQLPAVVGRRHAADDGGSVATTEGGRAQFISNRQRVAWEDMHERMERRRREWNSQVDRMRADFFKLKPSTPSTDDNGQSSTVIAADHRQQRVIDVEPSCAPSTITRQQFEVVSNISSFCSFSPLDCRVCQYQWHPYLPTFTICLLISPAD